MKCHGNCIDYNSPACLACPPACPALPACIALVSRWQNIHNTMAIARGGYIMQWEAKAYTTYRPHPRKAEGRFDLEAWPNGPSNPLHIYDVYFVSVQKVLAHRGKLCASNLDVLRWWGDGGGRGGSVKGSEAHEGTESEMRNGGWDGERAEGTPGLVDK